MTATATVVICAYTEDRWADIVRAVESVQAQVPAPGQIVVVADHNEALRDAIASRFGDITVVPNRFARGLSGARNSGIAAATGEIVVFLDDDAHARAGWLDAMVAAFGDATVMSVGGAVEPDWVDGAPAWFPDAYLWVVGCSYRGLPTERAEVRNPIGASMAIRGELFAELGGFTEGLGRVGRIPLGCEETELCIRASRRWPDRRHVYEPSAMVAHRVPSERQRGRYFARRCFAEGLSKAAVTTVASRAEGLGSERTYVREILPRSVQRALRRRSRAGALEAGAIVAGLTITVAGYATGRVVRRRPAQAAAPPPPAPAVWAGPMTPVSVVIPTRHRPALVDRCLASMGTLDYPTFEIIVVDNGPSAATEAVVDRHRRAGLAVRYVAEPVPGASRARNRGLALAAHPYVAFTDDDVVVDPGWLRGLTSGFRRADDVVCVTGLVLPARLDTDAQVWFEEYGGFSKGPHPRVFDLATVDDVGPLYPYSAGTFGSGNNVAFRADALRAMGGYDTRLGPGTPTKAAEELDLFLEVITSGHRLAYEPSAIVHHEHRATLDELCTQLHDYGVGLSALMAKWAFRSPRTAIALARRLPGVARHLVSAGSAKNARRSSSYPSLLKRAELRGMAAGPLALVRAGRAERRRFGA